jgi:antitoxin component YwqK of YwqJK toxin-antitoxin module
MFGFFKSISNKFTVLPINEAARRQISFLETFNTVAVEQLERKEIIEDDSRMKVLIWTEEGKPFNGVIVQRTWNGNPLDAWEVKNGFETGFLIAWHSDRKIRSETFQIKGICNGRYACWNDRGVLRELGYYENGYRHGEYQYFDASALCYAKLIYKNNKVISNKVLKTENGMRDGCVIPIKINGQEVWEDGEID